MASFYHHHAKPTRTHTGRRVEEVTLEIYQVLNSNAVTVAARLCTSFRKKLGGEMWVIGDGD